MNHSRGYLAPQIGARDQSRSLLFRLHIVRVARHSPKIGLRMRSDLVPSARQMSSPLLIVSPSISGTQRFPNDTPRA